MSNLTNDLNEINAGINVSEVVIEGKTLYKYEYKGILSSEKNYFNSFEEALTHAKKKTRDVNINGCFITAFVILLFFGNDIASFFNSLEGPDYVILVSITAVCTFIAYLDRIKQSLNNHIQSYSKEEVIKTLPTIITIIGVSVFLILIILSI